MKTKGLCNTCVNDNECTFPRKFPVWQCEEFAGIKPKSTERKKTKRRKRRK